MENVLEEQRGQQGEQTPAQTTRPRPQPTPEQLARFAAADHQTKQKRKAPEPFALEVEAPARRTQAPQSSGVHNQRYLQLSSSDLQQQEQTTISAEPPIQCQASSVIPSPELEPNQERLNFDFLMQEKDKQIASMKMARSNWLKDTKKYSEEMTIKLREKDEEIQRLQAQVQSQPPQQSMGQETTDALIAEGQALQANFHNQAQNLVSLQQSFNQQADILANLTARLTEKSQESSDFEMQLDIRSFELSVMSEELKQATKEVSSLRRESDQKSTELNESNGELREKSEEIEKLRKGRHHDSKKLSSYERQVDSQSKEIAYLQASQSNSESSSQEKDRKIASLRELLDNSKPQQSTSLDQERVKRLEKQLAESQAMLEVERSDNASLRDQQARSQVEDLRVPVEPERGTMEVDTELLRVLFEQEREKMEAENSRREVRVDTTLEGLEETERERRRSLMDELERNNGELYDAQRKIRELEERLLVSSSTQPAQQRPSPLLSSPPPPQPSTQHSSPPTPTLPTSPAADPRSRLQRSRFPARRSLLIVILVFLLAFFVPHLQSAANSASQDELVGLGSRADRIRWEAWELASRERNEGLPTYEEGWRRTEEVGRMGDWGI